MSLVVGVPDVSVVLVAHDEGLVSHRSVRSVQRAVEFASDLNIELIAILDAPSGTTRDYFERNHKAFNKVVSVDFGDSGKARNHGVALASGKYIAFVDAVSLVCANWLSSCFRVAETHANQNLILHPEANLYFGQHLYLQSSIDSDDPSYNPLELVEFNPWTPMCFALRSTFQDTPFKPTDGTFNDEAWRWNCQMIASGFNHRIVKETVHFIRTPKDPGFTPRASWRSELFDLRFNGTATSSSPDPNNSIANNPSGAATSLYKKGKSFAVKLAMPHPNVMRFCMDVASAGRTFATARRKRPLSCNWLINEWRAIHDLEPALFPSTLTLKDLELTPSPRSRLSAIYRECYEALGESPTHVFLLPWIKRGGSDLEALHYINAVKTESVEHRVVCITTENRASEWLAKLPEGVRVLELGTTYSHLSVKEKATLLTRLLVQKRPKVIHNINSAVGYEMFIESGAALSAHSKLFVTNFCEVFMPDGSVGGFCITELPRCIDYVSHVFTDSRYLVDKLVNMFGFERDRFSVAYVPLPAETRKLSKKNLGNRKLNVLWASRLDVEKRVDVLLDIARRLVDSPIHFHIHGEPWLHPVPASLVSELSALPNATMYGAFDGIKSIKTEDYDLFVYTSEHDGLPNVLLESISAGLPVIAPNVGGISELITNDTGFLVSGPTAVDEYVNYLQQICRDYDIVAKKVEAASALLTQRHSWPSFVATLRRVPEYFLHHQVPAVAEPIGIVNERAN